MIDSYIFEFPLSLILSVALVLCIVIWRYSPFAGFLTERPVVATLMAISAVALAIEGTYAIGLFHHWAFLLLTILLLLSLGYTAFKDLRNNSKTALASHLGLFLTIFGAFFGSPDVTDTRMKVYQGEEEHIAIDRQGRAVPLPFNVTLEKFTTEFYSDGTSPKQYTSLLLLDGKSKKTNVNHPCHYKGYHIYQVGYGEDKAIYSVLKIVRDPWLPIPAVGAIFLAIGAILGLRPGRSNWKFIVAVMLLAVIFTFISIARIQFGTLMPALRSLWFVPHLAVYMLAYALLAMSVIMGIASAFSSRIPETLSPRLLSTASSLLLVGMLCGAVWAEQAWGDYWTWDPKECWAAATWMLTLAGTHLRAGRKNVRLALTILAFLAMQISWYGVNYLPSSEKSLHTYNQKI